MFWFKKKINTKERKDASVFSNEVIPTISFTVDVTANEKEEVMAYLAQKYGDVKVHSIAKVDQDKEAAAVIAAAVLAHDKPKSTFRLVSITECEGRSENA